MSDPIGLKAPHPDRKPHPANGLFAQVHLGDRAYASIVDPRSYEDGSAGWRLTWGGPEEIDAIRYCVASALESYDYLLSDAISAREAVRRLRVLRQARRDALAAPNGAAQ